MDRIGDSAKKGLDFIKNRARETVEVQKMATTIKQLEQRREECLLDLGLRVLVCYGTDDMTDASFRDRVEEVRELSSRIETLSAEYEETKTHLKQSMEDLIPKRPGPPIPSPDYEQL